VVDSPIRSKSNGIRFGPLAMAGAAALIIVATPSDCLIGHAQCRQRMGSIFKVVLNISQLKKTQLELV
jgi:hypothetical protein